MASSLIGTPKPAATKEKKYALGGVVDRTSVIATKASAGDDEDIAEEENIARVCPIDSMTDAVASIDTHRPKDSLFDILFNVKAFFFVF